MPEGRVGQVLFLDVICEPAPTFDQWLRQRGERAAPELGAQQLAGYRAYLDRRQPWRSVLLVEGNREPLFISSESYYNEQDCRNAARMGFGPEATIFERRHEHGLNLLRRGREATPEEQQG